MYAARAQLLRRERLDQIVVGTAVQARDAVSEAVARRQHQGGRGVAAGAPRAQPIEARAIGQLPIDEQGVVGLAAQGFGGGQALAPIDAVAVGTQEVAQAFAERGVVFDQQEAHGMGGLARTVALPRKRDPAPGFSSV